MVHTGEESAVVPGYLLRNYQRLNLSDKDLLTLITFLAVEGEGKTWWQEVAAIRGYPEVRYLKTAMGKLQEEGLVNVDEWALDISPLLRQARNGKVVPQAVNLLEAQIIKKQRAAQPKSQARYSVWEELQGKTVNGSREEWGGVTEKLFRDHNATVSQIVRCSGYIMSILETRNRGKGLPELLSPWHLTKYYAAWKSMGEPDMFSPEAHSRASGFAALADLI